MMSIANGEKRIEEELVIARPSFRSPPHASSAFWTRISTSADVLDVNVSARNSSANEEEIINDMHLVLCAKMIEKSSQIWRQVVGEPILRCPSAGLP